MIARIKPSFYFVKIFTFFKMSIYVKQNSKKRKQCVKFYLFLKNLSKKGGNQKFFGNKYI